MRISDWSSDVCSSDLTSALGGGLAGLGACLLVLLYDIHPAIGLTFGPITFMVCVLGGLGNMIGGFIAAFIFAEFIALGGFYAEVEWGYVLAFVFFIVMMFIRPQGILGRSEEHTSELQSLMRISYAVFCLKTKNTLT